MTRQQTDSSRLSLDEFCFRSNSVKFSEDTSGKFRDVIEAFRTVYWFHSLRIGLKANTTYQLEQTLEPDAFVVKADGSKYRRNKWGGYRLGKHTPSPKQIISVNVLFDGSQSEFEHVLWDTLQLSVPVTNNINAYIRRLAPDVQSILWNNDKKVMGTRTRIRQLTAKHLQMIERRASLDALACLTLLLREAHETGKPHQSFKIARSLCRVLLMIGDILNGHGISRPLHEYYEQLVLPLGSWQEKRYSYQGMQFMELVGWLYHGLSRIKNVAPSSQNERELMHYKLKLLDGNYGWDYLLLLNPIEVSTKAIEKDSAEYREQDLFHKRRLWAQNTVLTSGDGLALPIDLI